jgi:hypothetical protein
MTCLNAYQVKQSISNFSPIFLFNTHPLFVKATIRKKEIETKSMENRICGPAFSFHLQQARGNPVF